MKLYNFFRSSASYRVRIALNLKGLPYEYVPIHLRRDGGEQYMSAYKVLNPQGIIPTLEDDGRVLTQSLAIIEYLEERYPEPPLLPRDPADRAIVRSMALAIACEVHPLQNLRVLNYVRDVLHHPEEEMNAWGQHWITQGFTALEQMVRAVPNRGAFCFGNTPSLADLCLVPQFVNARRFGCDLSACPTLGQIDATCRALPAFANATPENQLDAE
ncbi:MAG TPA: maleylacetoacetate isomerase [Candidatus Binatia bacterium]|nr:maleylacetoacetate isomerase [Candidatus Binatia bacterium]